MRSWYLLEFQGGYTLSLERDNGQGSCQFLDFLHLLKPRYDSQAQQCQANPSSFGLCPLSAVPTLQEAHGFISTSQGLTLLTSGRDRGRAPNSALMLTCEAAGERGSTGIPSQARPRRPARPAPGCRQLAAGDVAAWPCS